MCKFIFVFTLALLATCTAESSEWDSASTWSDNECCVDLSAIFPNVDDKVCAKWEDGDEEASLFWDENLFYDPKTDDEEICNALGPNAFVCGKITSLEIDADSKTIKGCGEGYLKLLGAQLPTLHECITFGDNKLELPSDIEYLILALKKFI